MKTRILLLILFVTFMKAYSQTPTPENYVEVYGFAMTDMGYNLNQVNPDWYDVMRPSRLPAYKDQFGKDGSFYFSARQSRFGIKSLTQTEHGEFKTVFDFDMFGVGANAGQTTIRLRHAYGQLGHFGAGQTESAFMDLDVFPNTFEYWGPCGMLFFRNVQVRWIPILGPSNLVIALEAPGASGDKGVYQDLGQLSNLQARYIMPDLTGHYRSAQDWGYVQLGGVVRSINYDDLNANDSTTLDLSGNVMGYGVSLSSNINIGKNNVVRLQGVYGAGVENYFNDAPVDVAAKKYDATNTKTPIKGEALVDVGLVAFLDHTWNDKWTSSVGYSTTMITNSEGQNYDAYKKGQFVEANLIYSPVPNVLAGVELQWIDRENKDANPVDGFKTSSATKINFSFKYSFSQKIK